VGIGKGYLVLVGVSDSDEMGDAVKLGKKLAKLRLMADEVGKLNRGLLEVGGELLLVSQFTLIAEVGSGNRPSFVKAAQGQQARTLFDQVVASCRQTLPQVKVGFFGQQMEVELVNDGPVTLVLDTKKF
jgi:D-tyrosyl-tRNA(Tyr) deacylase